MGTSERNVYIAGGIGVEISGPKNVVSVGRARNTDKVAVGLWIGLASGAEVTEVMHLISSFEPQFQVIKVFTAIRIQRDQISKIVNTISRKECSDDVLGGIIRLDNRCGL